MNRFFFSLFALCLICVSPALKAEDRVRAIAFTGVPWVDLSELHKREGIIPKFWQELEAKSGLKIDLEVVPYKRMLHNLEAGFADAAIFFKTPTSEKMTFPVVEVGILPTSILSKKKAGIAVYEDLIGKSVGVKRGVLYEPRFDQDRRFKKIAVKGYEDSLRLLKFDRVDAIVGSEVSLTYQMALQKMALDQFAKPLVLKDNRVYLQIAKRATLSKEARERLIKAAQALAKEGVYQKLIEESIALGKKL